MMKGPIHQEDKAISNSMHWNNIASKSKNQTLTELQEQLGQSIILKRDFNHWTQIGDIYDCAFSNSLWSYSYSQIEIQWGNFQEVTQLGGGQTQIQIQAPLTPKAKQFPVENANKN